MAKCAASKKGCTVHGFFENGKFEETFVYAKGMTKATHNHRPDEFFNLSEVSFKNCVREIAANDEKLSPKEIYKKAIKR